MRGRVIGTVLAKGCTAYDSVSAARSDVAEYLVWYNVRFQRSRLAGYIVGQRFCVAVSVRALIAP